MDVLLLWVIIVHVSGRDRYVKIFEGMVSKLKEVRYVPQLKRNLISVGALKAFDLEVSIRDVFSR